MGLGKNVWQCMNILYTYIMYYFINLYLVGKTAINLLIHEIEWRNL